MLDDKTRKEFAKWGAAPPTSEAHGTDEDIRSNMVKLMPNTWHLEGNQLKGQTSMGELSQTIPTDYILTGTDDKGLPVFRKVLL